MNTYQGLKRGGKVGIARNPVSINMNTYQGLKRDTQIRLRQTVCRVSINMNTYQGLKPKRRNYPLHILRFN